MNPQSPLWPSNDGFYGSWFNVDVPSTANSYSLSGSPPLELVQLALVSPHRALASCWFSMGLLSGLFRQLRPLHSQLSNPNPLQPRIREWTVPLPAPSTGKWPNLLGKAMVDVIILALAGIMLWQNWVVNSFTMIPWRCEYTYLLFCWRVSLLPMP